MMIEEKFIETKFGKICYLEAGKGKRILILFHGFASSPIMIKYLAAALAGKGFRIMAPYLLGHGKSFRNTAIMLEEFVNKICPGKFSLFGASLGGDLALAIAERLDSRIEKLILQSPLLGPLKGEKLVLAVWGLIVDSFWDGKRYLSLAGKSWRSIRFSKLKQIKDLIWGLVISPLGLLISAECPKYNLRKKKVLVLWGKYDHALNYKKVSGKIHFFDSGHHFLLSQPEGFLEKIVNFLET